jgi:transposase
VDECGLNEAIHREYARAPIGEKVVTDVSGKRSKRTSIIAGLNQQEIIAPFYFSGYCNTELIVTWVKKVLLPCLKSGMILIWDNASFHQSGKIKELIESVGCKLLFLPPYSPDLNPIEHYWATLKAYIRRLKQGKMTIPQALEKIFRKTH